MPNGWYPNNKEELNRVLDEFLSEKPDVSREVNGLIVPHAGYQFSGKIAGKAFSLLKGMKISNAVIIGPSHYTGFEGVRVLEKTETPFGKIKIIENDFKEIGYEHSVDNQIPFLQKLNPEIKVLPLVIGEISNNEAENIAKKISEIDGFYIFSTDLSHFLDYEQAIERDKKSIKIIQNLDLENWKKIDVCGIFPLLVMAHLCRLKGWKPFLIEYKNSGDIIGDKSQVVGYASFWF